MEDVTILLALTGGFLAFISPCCLPLYPSFISYITGISIGELKKNNGKGFQKTVLLHSISFSIGFSIIYYVLGFSFSKIGTIFVDYQDLIRMLGGVFLVFMGLFLTGLFVPKFMLREFRFQYNKRNATLLNSLLVGIFFAMLIALNVMINPNTSLNMCPESPNNDKEPEINPPKTSITKKKAVNTIAIFSDFSIVLSYISCIW